MSKLSTLPNIGKVTEGNLKKIGITTAEEFLRRDPYQVFKQLLDEVDPTLCKSALAGIVGAWNGVKWNTVSKEATKEFDRLYPDHHWK